MKSTYVSRHEQSERPVYLDCNATTPLEPDVRDVVAHWMAEEIGNAGSRTHTYGSQAKRAVQHARKQVAAIVEAAPDEIVFTSGATESNNLAILGLAPWGEQHNRRHIVSTAIEHKAVLEPLEALEKRGFSVTLVRPQATGAVAVEDIAAAVQPDTLLVSVMHVNNETGVRQPIAGIAKDLADHDAYLHVDAAQGFGKELEVLRNPRIDLISVSSHKVYGPLGIGALVVRRRGFKRLPLTPLIFGGGQELGLRPGTLPVPLIVGFGLAAEIAGQDNEARKQRCLEIRKHALSTFEPLGARLHGDPDQALPHVLNFSIEDVDSEALIVALKDVAAVSNGSACTSHSYQPSHVLQAMGLEESAIAGALRLSWCHLTPDIDWKAMAKRIRSLL